MKKIAFMFAAAAMFVACTEAPKTATQEQKDSIMAVVIEECKAAIEAPVAPEALAEDADDAAKAAFEEATLVYDSLKNVYDAAVAAVDTTNAEVKAAVEARIAEFEAALNAPVEAAAEAAEEATEE